MNVLGGIANCDINRQIVYKWGECMSKRKHKRERAQLYQALNRQAQGSEAKPGHDDTSLTPEMLAASPGLAALTAVPPTRDLPKMKKFRFQLLHTWMLQNLSPGRVADIGGGKGLLAYLLQKSGWPATVIDPTYQTLPTKYKDLDLNRRVKIGANEQVPHISQPYHPEHTEAFDILVAMHAHGCNVQIIDAVAAYGRSAILLPCCIIQEPLIPEPGVHWLECLVEYALSKSLMVEPFQLNFRGQNIGLYMHSPAG